MTFSLQPNKVLIFPNKKKTSFKSPSMNGKMNIDGVEMRLSAWDKDGKITGNVFTKVEKGAKPVTLGSFEIARETDKEGNKPDYRGELKFEGRKLSLSLWKKKGIQGSFLSGNIGTPENVKTSFINKDDEDIF